MISRFRDNFRLAIISLLGLTGACALSGFLVWRLVRGDWAEAFFDGVVVAGIVAIVWLAWRERRLELAGTLMVAFNTAACLVASVLIGEAADGWIYVVLMTNFYIAGTRMAAVSGLALVIAATFALWWRNDAHHLSTVVTWVLVYAFSYAFSRRVRLHSDSLERRANRDPLTQMSNRGVLESRLGMIVSGRDRGRFGLLILDIDRFKSINDEFGHGAGDVVLVALADVLRDALRKGDSVYRFGGEEFVLVLPIGSEAALSTAAERIRLAVSEQLVGPGGPVTVSIGGAMHDGEQDWQDWFARADAALYLAKRAGRDRVHVASPLEE